MESIVPVCRICLNSAHNYINFQTRFECDEQINYLQCLRFCTNLQIDEDDEGPQCLCAECEAELQIVYKFLRKAQNSQAILEEGLHNNDYSHDAIEHTEISIEKCDTNEIANDDLEPLGTEEYFCVEMSNDCNETLNDRFEGDKIVVESNNENEVAEIEEVLNEDEPTESVHEIDCLPQDSRNSQPDKHIFIPKTHKCHICNRCYTTERLLKVHLNYHRRRNELNQPYICKICGEEFSLQRYLTQHMLEHEDYCRETYKCRYCDKEYFTKTALISHKRIHQGEALTCTECGKQFTGSYEYTVHLRFHKREKEQGVNKCEICNKEYSSPRYLSQHMVVHLSDRKTHKCSYCNKEYVSKTTLNNHKRLHEGETIKCDECGKQFTRNCELQIHMRFHKSERPFKCTICEKKFTIKGHLRTHMWQHEGIKLECQDCGKLFASTKALNEHSHTHGEMPYPCEFCDKAYPSKQKYKIHFQKMHYSEDNDIDLSRIETSATARTGKMGKKKFTYVQIIKESDANKDN